VFQSQGQGTAHLLDRSGKSVIQTIRKTQMTLMDATTKHRRYASVSEEKAGGATYTPTLFADFVARRILDVREHFAGTEPLDILDPAVGDGELLLALLRGLPQGLPRHIRIFGFDTNADALDIARERISREFGNVQLSLVNDDFLRVVSRSDAPDANATLFQRDPLDQYDLVIANPPYVRTQIMGADEAQRLGSLFGLTGRVDLYHAFVAAIARVLKPSGTMGVIVSNRFMTTRGGGALRAILRKATSLRHVWDFGDTKLFDAAVLPAVIIATGLSDQRASKNPSLTTIYETKEPATHLAATVFDALELEGAVKVEGGRTFRVEQGILSDASEVT
jgi:adenine-specific DNA-methyltransferase